jgi:toxin ParE1/3/4
MPYALVTDRAVEDLDDIWFYIALDNVSAADRTVSMLRAKAQSLAEKPGLGPARDELSPGLRSFPVGKYVILYRLAPYGIDVIRVLHGGRDIKRIFGSK